MNYHVNDRTPERELDARIATEVMGWQVRWVEVNYHRRGTWLELRCKKAIGGWFKCPWFVHDVGDAWLVVEKMRELQPGWRFGLLGGDANFGGRYKAEWFGHIDPNLDYGQRHGQVYADTAPLAICLAALKAVGGDHR